MVNKTTTIFEHRSHYPCDPQQLYDWHSRFGALERLLPPWEKTKIIYREGGIDPGGRVVLKMHAGPVPFQYHAHHVENIPGEMFRDVQEKGPFSSFSHSHYFSKTSTGTSLYDKVEYSLPLGKWLPSFLKKHVHKRRVTIYQVEDCILLYRRGRYRSTFY